MLGYASIKLNDKSGKLRFGDYRCDLHEGPVIVEEAESHKKTSRYIWVTVAPAGSRVKVRTPPDSSKAPKEIMEILGPKL